MPPSLRNPTVVPKATPRPILRLHKLKPSDFHRVRGGLGSTDCSKGRLESCEGKYNWSQSIGEKFVLRSDFGADAPSPDTTTPPEKTLTGELRDIFAMAWGEDEASVTLSTTSQ